MDGFVAQPPLTGKALKIHGVQHMLLLLPRRCCWSVRLAACLGSCPGERALGAQGGCLAARGCMWLRSQPGQGKTTWPAAGCHRRLLHTCRLCWPCLLGCMGAPSCTHRAGAACRRGLSLLHPSLILTCLLSGGGQP